jgi:hypothetical protein
MEGDKKCKDCIRCYKTRELEHMLQTTTVNEECEKDSWDDWDLTEVQNLDQGKSHCSAGSWFLESNGKMVQWNFL